MAGISMVTCESFVKELLRTESQINQLLALWGEVPKHFEEHDCFDVGGILAEGVALPELVAERCDEMVH